MDGEPRRVLSARVHKEMLIARFQGAEDVTAAIRENAVSKYASQVSAIPAVREFLLETSPETAVISVGDNSYGHPTEETMGRLAAAGAEIYRTDEQGSILVTVYGGEK